MSQPYIILQVDPRQILMTLRQWHEGTPKVGRLAWGTVEDMARAGQIPGAYKPKGRKEWWINLIPHVISGVNELNELQSRCYETETQIEENDSAPTKGNGRSRGKGRQVVRTNPPKRSGGIHGPLQRRRSSGKSPG